MKNTLIALLFCLVSTLSFAQAKNEVVLRFLGIPVDGTKEEMIARLKEKGFTYNAYYQNLRGEFNGKEVEVYLHTTHNKIDRVFVQFPYTSEENIKNEYNTLLSQFNKNKKYMSLFSFNTEIPDNEDISFEIAAHKKRYQSVFYYNDLSQEVLLSTMLKVGEAALSNEEFEIYKQNMEAFYYLSDSAKTAHTNQIWDAYDNNMSVDTLNTDRLFKMLESSASVWPGQVWFMISEHYGKYCICLYYDNILNKPNGDDL